MKTLPLAVAPFTDADIQWIAALPAAEQVEEVRKELMRRNPEFDGTVEHKIEGGGVTEIRIVIGISYEDDKTWPAVEFWERYDKGSGPAVRYVGFIDRRTQADLRNLLRSATRMALA